MIIGRIFDDDSDQYTKPEEFLSDAVATAINKGLDFSELDAAAMSLFDNQKINALSPDHIIARKYGDNVAIFAMRLFIARQARKKRMNEVRDTESSQQMATHWLSEALVL